MTGLNKVLLVGRLGTDPDIRTSLTGKTVAYISIGVSENIPDKNGGWKTQTEWYRVTAFDKTAEKCSNIKKGELVYLEGRLSTWKQENSEGGTNYITRVIAQAIYPIGARNNTNNNRNGDTRNTNFQNKQKSTQPTTSGENIPAKDNDEPPF